LAKYGIPTFPVPPPLSSSLIDKAASTVASWILHTVDVFQNPNLPQSTTTVGRAQHQNKLHHLSNEKLTHILLQDVRQRNSLVTADFTTSIYDDDCRFKDGSNLDGVYPMKPWILGCRMLFRGDRSQAMILEESLSISSRQLSFRFKSDLEFRGPFRPQVSLAGRIVMTRNPHTGLIDSYQEHWDEKVWDVVKGTKFQL